MQEITNRSALLVTFKEPYKKWAKLYNEEPEEHLNDYLDEKHLYLVEYSFIEELPQVIETYYEKIFEAELKNWNSIKREWPKNRSLEVFLKWFKVTFCGEILDLESDEIEYGDEDDDE